MKEIRIMVVEDQTVVREALVTTLSFDKSIKVVGSARDGHEAIAIAQEQKPDVILLDLVMPRMNGMDAIPLLREVAPSARILILTGQIEAENVFHAIKAGAIGYLLKDCTYLQLLQVIRDVYAGQTFIDSSIAIKLIQEINLVPKPDKTPDAPPPVKIDKSLTLTERELQTLQLISKGLSNKEIGEKLVVDQRTIAKYVSTILKKLQLANRTQAALYAVRQGLDKDTES